MVLLQKHYRILSVDERFHAEVKAVLEANRFISASDFMFKFSAYLKEKFQALEAAASHSRAKQPVTGLTSMSLFNGEGGAGKLLTPYARGILELQAYMSDSYVLSQSVNALDETTDVVSVRKKANSRSAAVIALADKFPGSKAGNRTIAHQAESVYHGTRLVTVTFTNPEKNRVERVRCSCRQLSSLGIACPHIFIVLRVYKGGSLLPDELPVYLYDKTQWASVEVPDEVVFRDLAMRRVRVLASSSSAAPGSSEGRGSYPRRAKTLSLCFSGSL